MNTFRTAGKQVRKTRSRRVSRIIGRIRGTAERPRVSIFRSHKHVSAQIIDDTAGRTLAAASSQDKELREKFKQGGNVAAATAVAQKLAQNARAAKIESVVFDRRWYRYHGRVKAFADALRAGGLKF
jgi:large subunit ribosomal protein L18